MDTPYAFEHLPTASSTQDEARARLVERPVLVVADRQVEGRGRSGRGWRNADRAVAASLSFLPDWPPEVWPRLTLVAALGARAALGPDVGLKWPNDLMVAGRKVGGILTESDGEAVTIGWGANLWWPSPPDGMAGYHDADPGPEAASAAARVWAEFVLGRAAGAPDDWGRREYAAALDTPGRRITWQPDGAGVAVDVAVDGALIVDVDGGQVRLVAGEVSEVRPATLPATDGGNGS